MAKKSWINRWKKTPKFSTRKYNRCPICGRSGA
ncbi:MAG: type Z 30S ribosomal protein S14, partial [Candidatus Omnitrophica bacterium]|nr:type Z 30S ribosomal protein S14 [Candidatus Omnitrophota bacterium]